MNDSLFQVLLWIARRVVEHPALFESLDDAAGRAQQANLLARLTVLAVVGGAALLLALPRWQRLERLLPRMLLLIALLFLLSPTQFPWYSLWFLPLLPLVPVTGLIVLSGTMAIYYVRPLFLASGGGDGLWRYDLWFVWLSYLPAYLLLFRDGFGLRHKPKAA